MAGVSLNARSRSRRASELSWGRILTGTATVLILLGAGSLARQGRRAALVLVFAPRSDGLPKFALGVNAIVGAAIPVSKHVSISAALEVPYTYHPHQVIALTGLAGVAFRF